MEKLIITPKTRIFDLLEAYPELEAVLIACAPQFRKLTNPLLRRTITRITTISQAATIAGIGVEELVNRLRNEAGQGALSVIDEEDQRYNRSEPDWYSDKAIVHTIDIREMLNRDEQPVHEVLSAIKKLKEKEILEIIAPFIPAPLLDKSIGLGYRHWLKETGPEEFRIYYMK